MNEFIEKLIGRLEEQYARNDKAKKKAYEEQDWEYFDLFTHRNEGVYTSISIVNQLAEEYNKKYEPTMDLLEYGVEGYNRHLQEQYRKGYTDARKEKGWIPCIERLPVYLDNVLVCTENGGRTIAHLKHTPIEWRDMYMNKIDDVIAWKYLDTPYQPKGE